MSRRFWVAAVVVLVAFVLLGQPQAAKIPPGNIKMHLRPELQVAPGVFSLKAPDQPIRVLAFGDFGDGSQSQKEVAASMLQYHRQRPFDFAITLGDNFYNKGMKVLTIRDGKPGGISSTIRWAFNSMQPWGTMTTAFRKALKLRSFIQRKAQAGACRQHSIRLQRVGSNSLPLILR